MLTNIARPWVFNSRYSRPLANSRTDSYGRWTGNALHSLAAHLTKLFGGFVTCTVNSAPASQVSQGIFSGADLAVNGPIGALTWAGPMVAISGC